MYRIVFVLLMTVGMVLNMNAQDESAMEILTKWENASQYTINMIDSMPAEHFDFKPTPETRTFSNQVTHMVDNMCWLSSDYLGAEKFEAEKPRTKEEHMEYMRLACEYAGNAMEVALQDSTILNTKKDFFAGETVK